MSVKGVIIMYKIRRSIEEKYIKALERLFSNVGFENVKPLLSKVKSAEFKSRQSKAYNLLEFSYKKEDKSRIKEVDLLVVL
jgi:hypothetical protein